MILEGDAQPAFLRGIPEAVRCCIIASGQYQAHAYNSTDPSGSSSLMGGIDVYRHSPDDPVALNKDWYAVFGYPDDPAALLLDGPRKDREHWLDEIPSRYKGAEVISIKEDEES